MENLNHETIRANRRRAKRRKTMALLLAMLMLIGCVVGGTLAWLKDQTNTVTNVFTMGNIDITLAETKDDFKMVPGNEIPKDPTVTVKANSEACWLFVKVTNDATDKKYISYSVLCGELGEAVEGTTYITYLMADGWIPLDGEPGVYYREVSASTEDKSFTVIKDNKVYVPSTVTKEMMDVMKDDPTQAPILTFTAYAVQKANIADAATAWREISN